MKRYLMIVLVLLLSCGLVGYGNWLPQKEEPAAAVVIKPATEESSVQEASVPEINALATGMVQALPTVKNASFESVGAAAVLPEIVEPVVTYMEDEVQKVEEEREAEELEKAERDESQRVYSTAVIGSVVAIEEMAEVTVAPVDMSAVLFSSRDASGIQTYMINEDGVMKIWRGTAPAENAQEEGAAAVAGELTGTPGEEESSEETYEEESYEEDSYEEESYEEESSVETVYEEESSEEPEESSEEESPEEPEEESSEEESSEEPEEESSEEESSEEPEEEESEEDSENDDEDKEEDDSEEQSAPVYDIPSDGDYYYDYSWEIFNKTNELRASLGIAPLSWSDDLASFAAIRAQEITVSFSHYRPGGGHYSNYGPCHENIAWGYPTVDDVFEGWYTSPDHYDNLTDPTMSSVGISSYRYNGVMYWVMSFW